MVFKIFSLIFCASLVLQGFDAATIRDTRDASTTHRAGQLRLTRFVMNEIDNIARIKLENMKSLAESVLNDPKVVETKTVVMDSYLQDFRKFVEHVKNYGDNRIVPLPDGGKLLSEENGLFQKYYENDETEEAVIISNALKEHGFLNRFKLLDEPIKDYTNRFIPEAENYAKIVDEEEKTAVMELIKKIKNETDPKTQGDLIINYVQTFDIEAEEVL